MVIPISKLGVKDKISNLEKIYQLSPMQEGMLFHTIMNKEHGMYNQQLSFIVNGELDVTLLEKCFNFVIEKYDVLRTNFVYQNVKRPQQIVYRKKILKVEFIELEGNKQEKDAIIFEYLNKERETGFNLLKDNLIKIFVFKIDSGKYKLVVSNHHIILDGWSLGIITKDVLKYYSQIIVDHEVILDKPVQQFDTFIKWHKQNRSQVDVDYWENYLNGYSVPVCLPPSYEKTEKSKYEYGIFEFSLGEKKTQLIKTIAQDNKVTMSVIMQAIWGIVLQKYNDSNDVVFGKIVSGRIPEIKGIESMVGLCINIIPSRIKCEKEDTFLSIIKKVHKEMLESSQYENCPLSEIQTRLGYKGELFNNIIEFENYPSKKALESLEDTLPFKIKGVNLFIKSNYDMNISIIPDKCMEISIRYNASTYDYFMVSSIERSMNHILEQIFLDENILISEIELATNEDKKCIKENFNDTLSKYPKEKSLIELFNESVEKYPNRIAVKMGEKELTYEQLNLMANLLAVQLKKNGAVKKGTVALILNRSLDMIVSILGVLKTGAAYIPIEIGNPKNRILEILYDANPNLIIIHNFIEDSMNLKSENLQTKKLLIFEEINVRENSKTYENDEIESSGEDLAYIIYTSGTTGKPKGNLILHKNVSRVVRNTNYIDLKKEDILLQISTYAFDGSVFDIFGALLNGAKLILIEQNVLLDMKKLSEVIDKEKITIFFVTTALFNTIADCDNFKFNHIRYILFGGEKVSKLHVMKMKKKLGGNKLIHVYGPTESTVFASYYVVDKIEERICTIPIGKPIANTEIYIIDQNNKLQAIGAVGEMHIAGDGLAAGYLNLPEMTEKKFIKLPHITEKRLYKTGDLARWLPSGNIEYINRRDNQIKLRGFRIELGEIETNLMQYPEINNARVFCEETENQKKELIAYIVANKEITTEEIRGFLSQRLPEYMIPTGYVQINQMILNTNGKIDKNSLNKGKKLSVNSRYEAPKSKIEQVLCSVWEEILACKKVGITDNYFSLGGDSIKAIQIASMVQKAGMTVEISDIFKFPTIKNLSLYVKEEIESYSNNPVVGKGPLSPIQEWFFSKYKNSTAHFNQAVILESKQQLENDIVIEILKKIIQHHDALRMSFRKEENVVSQYNKDIDNIDVDIKILDLRKEENIAEKIKIEAGKIQKTTNPEKNELIKFGLFKTKNADLLLIVIHHLVVDGVSWRILLEDFCTGYQMALEGKIIKFQSKTASYLKWCKMIKEYSNNRHVLNQVNYWNNILIKNRLKLPVDRKVTENKVKNSKIKSLTLSKEDTQKLQKEVHQAYHTEINDILISVLAMSVKKCYKISNILINMEGHGREIVKQKMNVNRTIGWFTSMYPVLIQIDEEEELSSVIKDTKEILNHIPNNGIFYNAIKYLSFIEEKNKLVELEADEISFNYLGQLDQNFCLDQFKLANYSCEEMIDVENSRNYLLDINGFIKDEQLTLDISYHKDQYEEKTMDCFIQLLYDSFQSIIEHCVSREKSEYTPSDFSYSDISMNQLKQLENIYAKWEIEDIYKLTPMQEGMLYNSIVDINSKAYFEQACFTICKDINIELLENCLNTVISRHDSLRAVINYKTTNIPLQIILKDRKTTIYYEDLTCYNQQSIEQYICDYNELEKVKGFELAHDILIRLAVFCTGNREYRFVFHFHHIIMDGWCLGLIIQELFQIYEIKKNNLSLCLNETMPFGRYLKWLDEQDKEKSEEYWRKYLSNYDTVSVLPKPDKKEAGTHYYYEELNVKLHEEMTVKLANFSAQNNITMNLLFQAIWGILLCQYNCTNDVVFGTVVSGRHYDLEGVDTMIGLCINTIPVRVKADGDTNVVSLIKELQIKSLKSEKYDFYPLANIQKMALIDHNLFDHLLIFENYPLDKKLENLKLMNVEILEQTNYDFNITIIPMETMSIKITYNNTVYQKAHIRKIANHLYHCLETVIDKPDIKIKDIDILCEEEKNEILNIFNHTECEFPKDKLLHQLFEDQAKKSPNSRAVIYKNSYFSYEELNVKSNQLARKLRANGVLPNMVVAVMLERSLDMMVGLLAILKAGGAYLPIGIDAPKERVENILINSSSLVILTRKGFIKELNCPITRIFIDAENFELEDGSNLEQVNKPEDIAYVIYTSGSTGQPKGVMIEHRAVMNRLNWMQKQYPIDSRDIILQKTPYTFDVSVWELFWWTFSGAGICFLEQGEEKNPESIINAVYYNSVTVIHFVPSMLNAFLEYLGSNVSKRKMLSGLKKIFASGEALLFGHVREFHRLLEEEYGIELHNLYGPTETSIDVTYYNCTSLKIPQMIPIGKPIDNTKVYIMGNNKLQPIGVAGELCISGICLSRGYLNNIELTSKYFVDNPYQSGEKMYRTGDLARWLPDGNIEYLGRIDNQVKIRGFRIELGEIEFQLLKYEEIKEAVALIVSDTESSSSICAYVTGTAEIIFKDVKSFLGDKLPDYMIPSYFMQVEKIPLSSNGKVDRGKLPKVTEFRNTKQEYILPRNSKEELLTNIWKQVLGLEKVSIKDRFFAVGGDSIKAIQIISRLNKEHLVLNLNDIFLYQTIEELSEHITLKEYREANQDEVSGEIPLTPIQKWFFEQNFKEPNHWNQAFLLYREEGYQTKILQELFERILKHHDVLRCSYVVKDNNVIQYNKTNSDKNLFYFNKYDLREDLNWNSAINEYIKTIHKKVNIEKGPLVSVGQFITRDGEHLLISIHHLGIDGVSWRVLLEDFENGYSKLLNQQDFVFPKKTHSFKEWSIQLNSYGKSLELSKELEYWEKIDSYYTAKLPVDYMENSNQESFVKSCVVQNFSLSMKLTNALQKEANITYNTQINDLLLSALGLALYHWTFEKNIKIMMEGHGREDIVEGIDISRTVGWFTILYPVILNLEHTEDIGKIIVDTKEILRKIPKKGIGYGILKYLTERNANNWSDDIPEICFNYLGDFEQNLKQDLFEISDISAGELVSGQSKNQYRLNINTVVLNHCMNINIQYDSKVYEKDTIEKIGNDLLESLSAVIEHCIQEYKNTGKTNLTPSDVGDIELTMIDLEYMKDFIQSI